MANANNIGTVAKSAQVVTAIIGPAGSATDKYPIFQGGVAFYLTLATGPLWIQPSGGSMDQYSQGTGKRSDESRPFTQLQIVNKTPNPVIFSVWVGWGDYIDNRVIMNNPMISNVVVPTSPIVNSTNNINIPDLGGAPILDIDGVTWLALTRTEICVSNYDIATTYTVEGMNAPHAPVWAVHPLTDVSRNVNGNFRIHIPSSTINAIVSEVYQAIKPSSLIV